MTENTCCEDLDRILRKTVGVSTIWEDRGVSPINRFLNVWHHDFLKSISRKLQKEP
jgi:hypothetical protein